MPSIRLVVFNHNDSWYVSVKGPGGISVINDKPPDTAQALASALGVPLWACREEPSGASLLDAAIAAQQPVRELYQIQ